MFKIWVLFLLDTGRKLVVHKKFRRCPRPEAVVRRCSSKYVCLKTMQILQDNNCVGVHVKFTKFSRTSFFTERLQWLLLLDFWTSYVPSIYIQKNTEFYLVEVFPYLVLTHKYTDQTNCDILCIFKSVSFIIGLKHSF